MAKEKTVVVGQTVRRIDALGKVTGETPYPGDFDMDGQLYMKLRFSDRAHAQMAEVTRLVSMDRDGRLARQPLPAGYASVVG